MADDVMTLLRLSGDVTRRHANECKNYKIAKKIPKPVRLARSHIAYAIR